MQRAVLLGLLGLAAITRAMVVTDMDRFIEEVNAKIPNRQWVAGKNFDSIEDVLPLLGALKEPERIKSYRQGSEEHIKNYKPKTEFDSRTEWSQCESVSTIWDQSSCGSCWAVSTAGAISDRLCIHKNESTMVSAENLMDCCDICGNGCNGGYISAAWSYWRDVGLVTGGLHGSDYCQPYSFKECDHHVKGPYGPCPAEYPTPECKLSCTNSNYKKSFDDDKIFGSTSYDIQSREDFIKQEIETNGPVTAGFDVYADFPLYTSGVYQHTHGDYLGGHAVRIIGWGEEDGTPYWLIANSWNKSWGDEGLFKMRRGVNECDIELMVHAGMP